MKGEQKRIAIVGAGIAGLSTAYYLSKLSQQGGQPLEITLLEKERRLGGSRKSPGPLSSAEN